MNTKSSSSRLVGYARVSSNAQELKLQLDALTQTGCAKADIFTDKYPARSPPGPVSTDALGSSSRAMS
jgi:hypothetical protein